MECADGLQIHRGGESKQPLPPGAMHGTRRRGQGRLGHTVVHDAARTLVSPPLPFLLNAASRRPFPCQLHKSIETGKPISVKMINYNKAGQPFHNSLQIYPLKDIHGRVSHFCGILRGEPVRHGEVPPLHLPVGWPKLVKLDDTMALEQSSSSSNSNCKSPSKTKRSQKLSGSKRPQRSQLTTLQQAVSNTSDAVVLTEARPPYAITHVNAPWCKMCGYTQEEVEGQTNSILQGPETDEALLADLMASVRRGEPSSATLINYKKGGKRFVNQVSIAPVYNEHDELDQFMAMLHEVDEKPTSDNTVQDCLAPASSLVADIDELLGEMVSQESHAEAERNARGGAGISLMT